ncbi:MAG TPA: divergent polysaccharide deacetylase family protein, partial [Geminicoccaceae bacterium]|nr:divergent polysaccharide deacetylase family protein [Geminicoccaceae bacterium]
SLIAIIMDDLGPARGPTERAIGLPGPLTMAFLPYAEDLATQAAQARRAGHQVFVHVPVQPVGDASPGPDALTVEMSAGELREHLRRAIGRVAGATGVNNHMGSRATADARAMGVVMEELKRDGLVFVDSRTAGNSVAASVAAARGLPHTSRDVFLDHFPGSRFIERQLQTVEELARRTGSAVAIGHPYDTTLATLARWIPEAKARGFRFVTAGEVIAARGCGAGHRRGPGCGLVHEVAGGSGRTP